MGTAAALLTYFNKGKKVADTRRIRMQSSDIMAAEYHVDVCVFMLSQISAQMPSGYNMLHYVIVCHCVLADPQAVTVDLKI